MQFKLIDHLLTQGSHLDSSLGKNGGIENRNTIPHFLSPTAVGTPQRNEMGTAQPSLPSSACRGAVSFNRRNTKQKGLLEGIMTVKTPENPSSCVAQTGKAKSAMVAKLARFVRKAGLTYEDWRYVSRRVRQKCDLHPAAKPKKLPRVLTADQFRTFRLLRGVYGQRPDKTSLRGVRTWTCRTRTSHLQGPSKR